MKLTLDRTLINNKRPAKKKDNGIVYLLEFDLEDKKLIKIGITSRKIEERVCEILTSIWKRYRIFPKCYVKRYRKYDKPADVERQLHRQLEEFRYKTKYSFSGSTEFFEVDLVTAVELYDAVEG